MLRAGLGLAAPHPPDLRNLDCYRQAESEPRHARTGLWSLDPLPTSGLRGRDGRFVRVVGRVDRLRETRRSIWLDMEDGLSLRVARGDAEHFSAGVLTSLVGKEVEARGWVTVEGDRARMRVRHPGALRAAE
jgi:hypothetical protein